MAAAPKILQGPWVKIKNSYQPLPVGVISSNVERFWRTPSPLAYFVKILSYAGPLHKTWKRTKNPVLLSFKMEVSAYSLRSATLKEPPETLVFPLPSA